MIEETKQVFEEVAGRPNFGDEPKNFTSRMMWIALIAITVAGALLVYVFLFSVPKGWYEDIQNENSRIQAEYNTFLKTMIPQVQQSKSETDNLQKQVDSLESVVQKQNPIVELYNKRR